MGKRGRENVGAQGVDNSGPPAADSTATRATDQGRTRGEHGVRKGVEGIRRPLGEDEVRKRCDVKSHGRGYTGTGGGNDVPRGRNTAEYNE